MRYDYRKLSGKIVEVCGTQAVFAKRIGISERSVSLKLNNKVAFKQDEIQASLTALRIDPSEISNYFFTPEVQNF